MALLPVIKTGDAVIELSALAEYPAVLKADGVLHEEVVNAPFTVDVGVDRFTLSCDRSQFPDTDDSVIKCRAEASYDGGKTWELLASFSTRGGVSIAPDGTVQPSSWVSVPFKQPENPNRMVRTWMIPLKTLTTKLECIFHKESA